MSNDHRGLHVALIALMALLLIGPGAMMGPISMWRPGPNGVQANMPGWMWSLGMGFGWLAMLAFWAVLIVGMTPVPRWLGEASARHNDGVAHRHPEVAMRAARSSSRPLSA